MRRYSTGLAGIFEVLNYKLVFTGWDFQHIGSVIHAYCKVSEKN